ncbi:MAG TPA: hypothetical protein VK196_01640 [Magnetospirillum sp.]|nr:hypothetical protein [Magnetospirillum sp.]
MGWAAKLCTGAVGAMIVCVPAWAADNVPAQIEAARAAYQKNDLPRTAKALEAALADIHDRLGKSLSETMPPAIAGWQAYPAEIQGLGQVGGGLTVTRAYGKGEATLNASLFLDSPAVEAAAAMFASPTAVVAQPNTKRVKVAGEDALLRFDPSTKAGEITVVLGNRILLSIEGDDIDNGDALTEMAKGWNLSKIRALLGL